MEASPHPETLVGADRPFFTTRESLDDIQSLSSVGFARRSLHRTVSEGQAGSRRVDGQSHFPDGHGGGDPPAASGARWVAR